MNRYQVDGKTYLVIDGELWQLVAAVDSHQPTQAGPEPKRKYSRRAPKEAPVSKGKFDSTEERNKAIVADRLSGMPMKEMVRKYKLSVAGIYLIAKKWGQPKRQKYQCANHHTFVSNLPLEAVKCPDCGSREVKPYREPEVREEVAA
jgi:DNA-directed RNA polymerase subunit RPC12/RpoP